MNFSDHPYVQAIGQHDPVELLRQTLPRLDALLASLTPAQLEHKPSPDRWSVRELTCHLADAEIAWAWRLRMVDQDDHHIVQPWDQDRWARRYDRYSIRAARSTFDALRRWNLDFIAGLSEADNAKPLTHPERGEGTMGALVQLMAGHDWHHLRKLAERSE